jgi:hypothetical protein
VAGANPRLARRERARERGVGVAVDEHQRGLQLGQHRLEAPEDAGGLRDVRAAAGIQLTGRRRDAQLFEEDARELVVVVLAGVDDELVTVLAQAARDRSRLDELRAVADDRDDQPAASSSSMR